jgi:C-terminal processing protease CtpA/Prc
MKNGGADIEGSLSVGDILLKIDGENVNGGKHKKAVKLLQKSNSNVKIYVKRNPYSLIMLTESGIVPIQNLAMVKNKKEKRYINVSNFLKKKL